MTDSTFNLAQLSARPNWYDHLCATEAAMADEDRITWARFDAGWQADEGGWYAPDGTHESDWEDEGYPFPEDVAAYTEWYLAFYHHEAADNDMFLVPYPKAPPHRRANYRILTR